MNPKFHRLFGCLFLLALLAGALPSAAQDEKPVYKLGLVLAEKTNYEKERDRKIDTEVINAATDAFVAARRFKMVERNQLSTVFTEKSLQDFIGGQVNNKLTDVLDLDFVGVVGYTLETTKTLNGSKVPKWILDVRLIDVKTASSSVTLSSNRASFQSMLPPATPREAGTFLAQTVREAFPPLGFVIQIDGKDIVVDLGSESGLNKGDTLEIIQEGEKIIHPVTGKVIPAPLKVVGQLKVVSASPGRSTCKRASRGEVQIANMVRLKGTESAAVGWIQKLQRAKDELLKQK